MRSRRPRRVAMLGAVLCLAGLVLGVAPGGRAAVATGAGTVVMFAVVGLPVWVALGTLLWWRTQHKRWARETPEESYQTWYRGGPGRLRWFHDDRILGGTGGVLFLLGCSRGG